jgi:hypothetical protein
MTSVSVREHVICKITTNQSGDKQRRRRKNNKEHWEKELKENEQ